MEGRLTHVELPAADSSKAKEFYGSLFGWEFQSYGDVDYHMFDFGDNLGGAISGGAEGTSPTVYFAVSDIESSLAKVRELGGEAAEKQPVPGMGWFAACKDDQGTQFSLWQSDQSAS